MRKKRKIIRKLPANPLVILVPVLAVSLISGLLLAVATLPALALATRTVEQASLAVDTLPINLQQPPLPESTRILAADGTLIADLYEQNRIEVNINDVSEWMKLAVLAIEDSRFYEHRGIDIRGTARAFFTNAIAGGVVQGGSSITQQYVKNVLVLSANSPEEAAAARETSYARKLREMRYALAVERTNTKDEILQGYLNISYFGAGAHGVEAAARRYFSKSSKNLNPLEAATLAGVVQQPIAHDPLRNPEGSDRRRNQVLDRMFTLGYITESDLEKYKDTSVRTYLNPTPIRNGCTASVAPFFCDYVVQRIRNDVTFGATLEERDKFLRESGITIYTTLDLKAQKAAQEAVEKYIPIEDPSLKAAAISMVDPVSGEIRAMAQNRRWGTEGIGNTTYNYNVEAALGGTSGMQAGSTFKIFTAAAAIEQGYGPGTKLDATSPKTFENFVACEVGAPKFEPYTVRNSTRDGYFDMNRATAFSVNTYFVGLSELTGLCRPAEIAEELGVRGGNGEKLERVPSFTLGSAPVTPLMMASAVGAFANSGTYCPPIIYTKIESRTGEVIATNQSPCRTVLSPDVADNVTQLLINVIDGPIAGRTGGRMTLGRPAGGKTGTINDSAAVWFVGMTPDLAAAVWVGDPRGGFRYPLKNLEINGTFYEQVFGSSIPGPIWREAMLGALDGVPAKSFNLEPKFAKNDPGIGPVVNKPVEVVIDPETGLPIEPVAEPEVEGEVLD
ncbi:MAG: transglycosylase domain-containing protein [Candidatus Nanopelagicales bacterium]